MKHAFAAAMLTGALLSAAGLAQSNAPKDPTAQPPAAQTTSSQAPNSAPIQANRTSQSATAPANGATASQAEDSDVSNPKRPAPGSVIPVQLTKTIDAKKAKTGDQVVAKVMHDMRSTTGQILIAKDTKVIGHVTEAQQRSKEQKESRLALAFDRAITKDGQEMQILMSIQAVVGQQNNLNAGVDHSGEAPTPEPRTTQSPMRRPTQAPPSGPPPSADDGEGAQMPRAAWPPVDAHTQGVVAISNLSLQQANGDQGSLMTSEKNNVKLESGTMLLLKVNP